ncbi:hypothetical protein DH2020_025631 [Rehmannia glutinosa]|uniref:Cytochrome P450 protein n=1 Tax=Rehmannia glutinosa TaxID=99300 RepID=A0ABR0VZ75_REHGL
MDISLALLLFSAITCYLLWFTFISKSLKGPRVWPLLGSLPGLIENADRMHDWIADNLRACGGTYQTCICAIPFLARKQGLVTVTCDPKNLEHILKTGSTIIRKDRLGKPFSMIFLARGSLTRMVTRGCSRGRRLHSSSPLGLCAKPWLDFGPGLPDNSFASAFDRATEASLQRFIFPEVIWKLKKWLRLGLEVTLSRSLVQVDEYLSGVINARKLELMTQQKDANPHDDLLSRFMKKKESYSDKFLQHVALNFILAGRDTSSVALSWFFWLVMQNPRVEKEILCEICSVLIETRGADVDKLYPSVPEDSKHVVADDVLPDGTFVPAGSSITYSIYSAGRMRSTWGEDCLDFKPERWLSMNGDKFVMHDSYKFVAFNAGPRICLGKDLAYLQMKSIAAAVLLRHRLTAVAGHKVEQKMSLTLFMKDGLKVNVRPRDLKSIVASMHKDKDVELDSDKCLSILSNGKCGAYSESGGGGIGVDVVVGVV